MENNNDVIDLTESSNTQTIVWPRNITIDLNESRTVTPTPRHRCGRPNRNTAMSRRNCDEPVNDSSIVVINDSPAPAPLTPRPGRALIKNRRSLRTKKIDDGNKSKEEKDDFRSRSPIILGDCPICFDRLGKKPLASTICGHVFCVECLQRALKNSKRCPNCRTMLRGKYGYHPLYFPNK